MFVQFPTHAEHALPLCVPRSSKRSTSRRTGAMRRKRRPRDRAGAIVGPVLEQLQVARRSPYRAVSPDRRRGRSSLENPASNGPSTTENGPRASTSWPGRRSRCRVNGSPATSTRAVASRVGAHREHGEQRATNVHSQALPLYCLVAVSSMLNCSCVGSWAANSSYAGRKAAVTWFWILTVSARAARLAQQRGEKLGRPPLALAIVGHHSA